MATDAKPELERILRLAARVNDIPFAVVATLQDGELQTTCTALACKLPVGQLNEYFTKRITSKEAFVISDATVDPELNANPLVLRPPSLRFFAGVPLPVPAHASPAMLFLIDTRAREAAALDMATLADFTSLMAACLKRQRETTLQAADRKGLDEEVRFLGRVLDHIDEPVISLDRSQRIIYFNKPAARLCGIDAAQAIGLPLSEIIDYEWTRPEDLRRSKRSLARGGVWRGRNRVSMVRTGATLVLESAISVVFNARHERIGYLGILRDTTERAQFEEALRQSNQTLRALVDSAPLAIVGLDTKGRVTRWNAGAERLFGWSAAEVQWRALPTFNIDADAEFAQMLSSVLAGESFTGTETRRRRRDGAIIDVSLSAAPLRDATGRIDGVMTIMEDITDRKRAMEALWQAERNYRSIFENAFEGIFQSKPDGTFINANAALAAIYGYDSAEDLMVGLANIRRQLYVDPVRRAEFIKMMHEQEVISEFEAQVYRKDGSVVWISESARAVRDSDGNLLYYEGMVADITQRKEMEAEQKRKLAEAMERADRDPLTMLFNHRYFHKRLQQETDRTCVTGDPLAVALIDLDNFKFFNDVYGHSVGDDVLRQVASALMRCCRQEDVLARFGGDEFALLMPGLDAAGAAAAATRLTHSLDGMGYRPPGYNAIIPFSVSIGVAILPDDGLTRFELIERADTRLRFIKNGGAEDEYAERLRATLRDKVEGFSMLDALVRAVDTKDRYTRRHSEDVMAYAVEIARQLRLSPRQVRAAEVAGLLHDVGKIGVPDTILRKPGRLSDADMQAVRQHPLMGAIIVGAVPGFEDSLDAVRHHHERWDGGGYPFGLRGPEIPLLARLMAVADAYSAMTTDRPYRKGMRPEQALEVLSQGAGTQWDPRCVKAFIRARRSGLSSTTAIAA